MSDFVFIRPALPRRMVVGAGYGFAALLVLFAFFLLSGADTRRDTISQMEAVVERAEAVENNVSLDAGLGSDAFYTGDTPQLAQAALQTNLQILAESYSINIEVIRADQIEQIDDFVRLNLTLNGVAPEAEVGAFLHGLASLEPIVVVKQLTLRRARSTRSNTQRRVSFQTQLYGVAQR